MITIKKLIKIQKKNQTKRWILKSLPKIVKSKKKLRIKNIKIVKIKGKKQHKFQIKIQAQTLLNLLNPKKIKSNQMNLTKTFLILIVMRNKKKKSMTNNKFNQLNKIKFKN